VLNEILAKLNQNEKLVGGGALAVVVGWVLGLILTEGWYGASGAQALGLIALAAAIVAVVVLYLKYAPGQNITWPAPVPMIMLIVGGAAVAAGVIGLLMAVVYDPYGLLGALGISKPILLYVATIVVAGGGGVMAWGGYQEWLKIK
jgi:hypothetical protein